MKSVSLRNLVLFIRLMLCGRVRSWYGVTVCWGRYGWRTWWELVLSRWIKSSSSVLNSSEVTGIRHVTSECPTCPDTFIRCNLYVIASFSPITTIRCHCPLPVQSKVHDVACIINWQHHSAIIATTKRARRIQSICYCWLMCIQDGPENKPRPNYQHIYLNRTKACRWDCIRLPN